ncbi:protein phosphatase [Pseudomonas sp. SDI]|uniref:PP2C family protein-serine/threonine phosphatase n=1 Tax=Pseudomonas sp. SDI TaxID=2170734 RepID=UPI000DE67089|nr:PP2C family serine/threonine-protein phosphatase [Pseudomonas sp. SDI]PWB31959.1 protein phosphatase [Pseudomonas sp. SDI]
MAAVRSAGRTDRGKVRTRNEDAFLDCPERGLWVVADGMGGHQAGDLASQMVVAGLDALTLAGSFDDQLRQVRQCLHWLNRRLTQELTVVAERADNIMGSTVVALLLEDKRAACIWAGDSRCYLWRQGRLFLLSRDHSLRQQLIDEQQLSGEQARQHPSAHALTRALGASATLKLEILELEVARGDVFLLCSDGLYQPLSEPVLGAALDQHAPARALEHLFDKALHGRAADNLTAVVIRT